MSHTATGSPLMGSAQRVLLCWQKVNSLSPNPQLLIALHSPYAFLKPDCASALQRKAGTVTLLSTEQSVLYSPVCCGIIAKNGHISRISRENGADFLCSTDCVAEGEGFEPPVRFPAQRFSRPPVSTTHTSLRERGNG